MAPKHLVVLSLDVSSLAVSYLTVFILSTSVQASPARWMESTNQNNTSREKRQLVTCPGFPGFCSESFPGTTCLVICEFGRNNVPQCQADGTWTDIPRCIEHEPGVPDQTPGVCPGIPGYCSQDFPGGFCQFDCTEGPDIRSTCTKDGTWEPYPTCQGDKRETRDGCSHCPGPNGGPRDRSKDVEGSQVEQPRNIEISDQGIPQAHSGGSHQGLDHSHEANSRQNWRTENREQRRQHVLGQGQDRQNVGRRGDLRPNVPISGHTKNTQLGQRRKQGHRVDWAEDKIRFVNPVNAEKINHEDRPVWNQRKENNEDQFIENTESNFGSKERNGANEAFHSLSSTQDFTLNSNIERFPPTKVFPTLSSKILDYPTINESVEDFSLLSQPFEGFPSFTSETTDNFPQLHVGNHEKPQNVNVVFEKIQFNVESQSEKREESKQDLPRLKNTHDPNFRSIFGLSPAVESTTQAPSFQSNLFGLPIGEGLPNIHQTPLIKEEEEKTIDLPHNKQTKGFHLEQENKNFRGPMEHNPQQFGGKLSFNTNAERVKNEVNIGVLNSATDGSNSQTFNEAPRFIPGRRRNGPRRRQPGRRRSQRRRPHLRRNQGNLIDRSQQFSQRRQQNRFQDQLQRNRNQGRDQDQQTRDRNQDQIQRDKGQDESGEVTNVQLSCPREELAACVDICPGFNHVVYGACVAGCSKRCNRN